MEPSYPFDADLHQPGSVAAAGGCSHHEAVPGGSDACTREAVVSFRDADGAWQSGCSAALEELVEREEIAPLGQGA